MVEGLAAISSTTFTTIYATATAYVIPFSWAAFIEALVRIRIGAVARAVLHSVQLVRNHCGVLGWGKIQLLILLYPLNTQC